MIVLGCRSIARREVVPIYWKYQALMARTPRMTPTQVQRGIRGRLVVCVLASVVSPCLASSTRRAASRNFGTARAFSARAARKAPRGAGSTVPLVCEPTHGARRPGHEAINAGPPPPLGTRGTGHDAEKAMIIGPPHAVFGQMLSPCPKCGWDHYAKVPCFLVKRPVVQSLQDQKHIPTNDENATITPDKNQDEH